MWLWFVNLQIINNITRIVLLVVAGVALVCPLRAGGTFAFTPNLGQWDNRISYQLEIPGGYMYLEKDGITCFFIERPHKHGHDVNAEADHQDATRAHAFKTHFTGISPRCTFENTHRSTYYYNYFIGNDKSKWKSYVYSYQTVTYKNLYDDIDYRISTYSGIAKSEYVVKPGGNPASINLLYEGVTNMQVRNGALIVVTSLGEVIEEKPVSWQVINGEKKEITCRYVLKKNRVTFEVDKNYDPQYELIIDPVLMFATYIGATADNFGCTATYDNDKNVYTGALVYPSGTYPTTLGAFQPAFNANINGRDMGITKFSSDGSTLMYSTYLGGFEQEVPHSLVVNAQNELYVLGTTSSVDYPTTATAFDASFNGGSLVTAANQGISYNNGCDMVITHFNSTGTALLGSTFVGGSGNDGLNYSGALNYNYGDIIRGEIILDAVGNPVVSSTTGSLNFPVTAGAFQPTLSGGTDGCIFKMNPSLSTMMWASYFGGTLDDACYGVQMDNSGAYFMTGGTMSANLPVTAGVVGPVFGGNIDGFITKVSSGGNLILASTFLGTAAYDQSYLVQIDQNNDVYVFGQTLGPYPITPGIYNNGNSGQFLHKLNNTLSITGWSTRIGRNANVVDISPTAFLVNTCDQIYLCGWGGQVNTFAQALSSTTVGMPITPGCFQSTTDGSDFWLAILSPNATSLVYGTFFGGPLSKEHVDGGTSRFDKEGVVYQAVCAGCGSNDDFPTTAGAWSNVNPSPNCNIGVFKFNLNSVNANASFQFATALCAVPATVNFTNLSTGAVSYEWFFGDGNSSTLAQPQHTYTNPGNYQVTLVAEDTNTCNGKDTFYLDIIVPPPIVLTVSPSDTLCPGTSAPITANASNGATFVWTPAAGLSDPNIANPIATPAQSTTYSVIATDTNGCADTQQVYVHVHPLPQASFNESFTPCLIPVTVNALNSSTGTSSFTWIFGDGNTAVTTDAQHVYTNPGTYTLTLIAHDETGCGNDDTAEVDIFLPPPAVITITGTDTICTGQPTPISVSGGSTYVWSPPTLVDDPNSPNPIAFPIETTTYYVIGTDTNNCSDTADVTIYVFPPASLDAGPEIIYDFVDGTPTLNPSIPSNGIFVWSPATGLSCTNCPNPTASPESTTTYYLTFTDQYGCVYVDSVTVYVSPSLFIPNAFTLNGDGFNDYFQVFARNLSYFEILIFNRWGQLVFQSDDPTQLWDGTYKGITCPMGVYVWKVTYADQITPDAKKEKYGHVTLIR